MAAAMAPPFEEDMSESGLRPRPTVLRAVQRRLSWSGRSRVGDRIRLQVRRVRSVRVDATVLPKSLRTACGGEGELPDRSSEEARMFICELHSTMMDDIRYRVRTHEQKYERREIYQVPTVSSSASRRARSFLNSTFRSRRYQAGRLVRQRQEDTDYGEVLEELAERYGSGSSGYLPS
jgi:hypothetical protein